MNKRWGFKLHKLSVLMVLLSAQQAFAATNFTIAPYGAIL